MYCTVGLPKTGSPAESTLFDPSNLSGNCGVITGYEEIIAMFIFFYMHYGKQTFGEACLISNITGF